MLRELREGFGLGTEDVCAQNINALIHAVEKGSTEVLAELRNGYGLGRAIENLHSFVTQMALIVKGELAARAIVVAECSAKFAALESAFEVSLEVQEGELPDSVPDSCAICLRALLVRDAPGSEILSPKTKIGLTPCGHIFHMHCIFRIMDDCHSTRDSLCPLCRSNIAMTEELWFRGSRENAMDRVENFVAALASTAERFRAAPP